MVGYNTMVVYEFNHQLQSNKETVNIKLLSIVS